MLKKKGFQIDKLGYSDIVTYTAVVNGLCEVDKAKKAASGYAYTRIQNQILCRTQQLC